DDELTRLPGLDALGGGVNAVAISPDGGLLAVGTEPWGGPGVRLRVWRWRGGPGPPVWADRGSGGVALALSPHGPLPAPPRGRRAGAWSHRPGRGLLLAVPGRGLPRRGVEGEAVGPPPLGRARRRTHSFPRGRGPTRPRRFLP